MGVLNRSTVVHPLARTVLGLPRHRPVFLDPLGIEGGGADSTANLYVLSDIGAHRPLSEVWSVMKLSVSYSAGQPQSTDNTGVDT